MKHFRLYTPIHNQKNGKFLCDFISGIIVSFSSLIPICVYLYIPVCVYTCFRRFRISPTNLLASKKTSNICVHIPSNTTYLVSYLSPLRTSIHLIEYQMLTLRFSHISTKHVSFSIQLYNFWCRQRLKQPYKYIILLTWVAKCSNLCFSIE